MKAMTSGKTPTPAAYGVSTSARPAARDGRGRPQRSWVPKAIWGGVLAALVIAGGALLYGRIAQVQQGAVLPDIPQGVQRDPAARVRGAVVSISGDASHPTASYDPASGTVTVRFQSRYYDPTHTAALNRQYLATEGRLIIQLALYHDASTAQVVCELYHGRRRLATVSGEPGQDFGAYAVQYAPGLP